ncbi:MAG: DHH family phosphoesterase [Candidatus Aenigmarchaeota archaeon]|nr:DHH family phosphoesterase [Candidatus Aenigmarchaeota archaeon]
MNAIVEETIKPAVKLIESMKSKDKVAIVHGHDNDSICSATIIYKLLKNLYGIESKLIISGLNSSVTEDVLEMIKKIKPQYVVIVDISEVNVDIMTELRNIARVMIIDHHVPKGYVKITYVNPQVYDKQLYLPATYLCYKIYEKFIDVDEILWVAGIGTLSDMGLKNCNDLFETVKSKNNELVGNNENIDELLFDSSLLGKLAKTFDSARVVNGVEGSVTALNVLIKVKDYQDVLKGNHEAKNLLDWFATTEKEFNRLVKDFEKRKKRIKKIVLYDVISKYNMKSPLATYLSKTLVNEVLVIYQKSGKYIDVSFRRGKVCIVDLNKLASNSVKNIPDSNGGGHVQAAGCRFPVKYLNKFLRNLKLI